jgi:signal transduction histidine kinase
MGMLGVMRARLEQGRAAECDALADAAQNSLVQAEHLAHQLLRFARADEAVRSMIDLNDAIASVEVVLKCLTGPRTDVRMELGAGPMLAFCDGHQLESVLFNLVVNARDAMPDGGRICIETCRAELTAETLGLKRGRYVCVSVSDTGCGMSKAVISRAFDPFFTTKPPGKGTGLGLPMVKAFVDQSQGHVDAQSVEGLGTTIAIYLPSASA